MACVCVCVRVCTAYRQHTQLQDAADVSDDILHAAAVTRQHVIYSRASQHCLVLIKWQFYTVELISQVSWTCSRWKLDIITMINVLLRLRPVGALHIHNCGHNKCFCWSEVFVIPAQWGSLLSLRNRQETFATVAVFYINFYLATQSYTQSFPSPFICQC